MKQLLIASILALSSIASAIAGPAEDAARTHFAAIGSGDTQALMSGYADNAQLNWIGGPLDGTYTGKDSIHAVWEKFGKAGPLKVTVSQLEESSNPKGSTVTSNVLFEGKTAIKVRYVLTYRDGLLVNETWQIDPKLAVAAAH